MIVTRVKIASLPAVQRARGKLAGEKVVSKSDTVNKENRDCKKTAEFGA